MRAMVEHCANTPVSVPDMKDILDICQRAAVGDEEGRKKLMGLLFNRIHRTASYLSESIEEAEDVAQTACIEVLASAGMFRGDSSLHRWADRVTIFTAAKMIQKKTRRQRLWETYFQPPEPPPGVDTTVGRTEVRHRLAALIRKLKYSQREILLLRYIHGYTINEAAEICGIPVETARGRLKKGRTVLKKKVMTDPLLREWIDEWMQQ